MSRLNVQSEIYSESKFRSDRILGNSNSLIAITFKYDGPKDDVKVDEDGDLVLSRKRNRRIEIEHSRSTTVAQVGLQLWLGALVLADFVLFNGPTEFAGKTVLELGAGVGLTSIVAGIFARDVVSTDVSFAGILELIQRNIDRNAALIKSKMTVMPLDFYEKNWSQELTAQIEKTDVVLAADVIYDNELTEGFVDTLTRILECGKKKTVYVALEKRFVFTTADLDTVAPCYEFFLDCLKERWGQPPMSAWTFDYVKVDFPQYFEYERNKNIVLWRMSN